MDIGTLSPNAALAVQGVLAQGKRDYDSLRAMCADDAVLEFPFHPAGPQVVHGADAFISTIRVLDAFQTFSIEIDKVFDDGGDEILVEGRSRGTYRSGRPDYVNHYFFALTFRDGKLTRWREFFNPLEAMKQNYGEPLELAEQAPT